MGLHGESWYSLSTSSKRSDNSFPLISKINLQTFELEKQMKNGEESAEGKRYTKNCWQSSSTIRFSTNTAKWHGKCRSNEESEIYIYIYTYIGGGPERRSGSKKSSNGECRPPYHRGIDNRERSLFQGGRCPPPLPSFLLTFAFPSCHHPPSPALASRAYLSSK